MGNRNAYELPLSKVGGLDKNVQATLKKNRICTVPGYFVRRNLFPNLDAFAEHTGISLDSLIACDGRIELASIHGIGQVFLNLLIIGNITSAKVLAEQQAVELHDLLDEINAQERLSRRSPNLEEVTWWIQKAKTIEPFPLK